MGFATAYRPLRIIYSFQAENAIVFQINILAGVQTLVWTPAKKYLDLWGVFRDN